VHGDDPINSATDVAPPLHVSTTYRYPNDPSLLKPLSYLPNHTPGDPILADSHVYSRATAPNTSRLELILTQLLGAPCLSYASGLAASTL
jgi:cystathionine gamma-synthase